MDHDAGSPVSPDRHASSEPSSIRPNPFDDADASARKRPRTLLASSPNPSIDADPALPSTPDRPPRNPSEPVSSKVTLNFRPQGGLEPSIASPPSPAPSNRQPVRDRTSREVTMDGASEMAAEVVISSSSESTGPSPLRDTELQTDPEGPDAPSPTVESIRKPESVPGDSDISDDEPVEVDPPNSRHATGRPRLQTLPSIMMSMPYHTADTCYSETLGHVSQFLARGSTPVEYSTISDTSEPSVIEVIEQIFEWVDKLQQNAELSWYPTLMSISQKDPTFFSILMDMIFNVVVKRYLASPARDLVCALAQSAAGFVAFLVELDTNALRSAENDIPGLLSLDPLHFLTQSTGFFEQDAQPRISDPHQFSVLEVFHLLEAFQLRCGQTMEKLITMLRSVAALPPHPGMNLEIVTKVCAMAECLLRDSCHPSTTGHELSPDHVRTNHMRTMEQGMDLFDVSETILDRVVRTSINQLHPDHATQVVQHLGSVLYWSLFGDSDKSAAMLDQYCPDRPRPTTMFAGDLVALAWKEKILFRLIKSPQMQLRVGALNMLCAELVAQWKTYAAKCARDEATYADTEQATAVNQFNRLHLKRCTAILRDLGLIGYFLGPNCRPELILESHSVVGFLMVTKTFNQADLELFWQTFNTTQDPRVSDALIRMIINNVRWMDLQGILHMCAELHKLSIASLNCQAMKNLLGELRDWAGKRQLETPTNCVPTELYMLFLRVLQQSSVYAQSCCAAFPDLSHFAYENLSFILRNGDNTEARELVLQQCLEDVRLNSPTTSGSLQALSMTTPTSGAVRRLVEEHDFIRLLAADLQATMSHAQAVNFLPVLAHPVNADRRRLMTQIILHHCSEIDPDIGKVLWDHLVGSLAPCMQDRKTAWEIFTFLLHETRQRHTVNPFLHTCLTEYLPELEPELYCQGALDFLREALVPVAENLGDRVTGSEEPEAMPIELQMLWKMILRAPPGTIERHAIITLVHNVYMEGESITSLPLRKAHQLHVSLANRCLQQLMSSATELKSYSDGTLIGGDEPMVVVATPTQQVEQELQFSRSLQVLQRLREALLMKPDFSIPDIRSLIPQDPGENHGQPAELKYQSFDGGEQTAIKELEIGLQNTAASLFARLRNATGFENYQIIYHGKPLTPSEKDICKSLEDLNIKSGLILVRRIADEASTPPPFRFGALPLDAEILAHFSELWDCLSMEEPWAEQLYRFLVSLPADESFFETFDQPATLYRDVFHIGQPYKCLYAVFALLQYLQTRVTDQVARLRQRDESENPPALSDDQASAVKKALSIIVGALCDPEVFEKCPSEDLRVHLITQLVHGLSRILKEQPPSTDTSSNILSPKLLGRLLDNLTLGLDTDARNVVDMIFQSLESILLSSQRSNEFWRAFRTHSGVQDIMQRLLLLDSRTVVRNGASRLIRVICSSDNLSATVGPNDFAELFWPIAVDLVPLATKMPTHCSETFQLCNVLLNQLESTKSILDLVETTETLMDLLSTHSSTEDITKPANQDPVATGLIHLTLQGLKILKSDGIPVVFPVEVIRTLFERHLFPPEDAEGSLVPAAILSTETRNALCHIISLLTKDDPSLMVALLEQLSDLVPHAQEMELEPYRYDLPQQFDRSMAVRQLCGHSGLRNLSNTCYLNSFFQQLFMNLNFRRLILGVGPVREGTTLSEMQALFAILQDSIQRVIDPNVCVNSIMNYDNQPIDVTVQMDVDEFYNLLFDRLEAQMPNEVAKKATREFYSGRLVQQIKSKECTHISERLEPFSAIQCDVMGKTCLEESLQAYVEGEIMEGENKYKCSECNQHVDAVKRACFKDIPDNLIIHLKRFNYNLQTMLRAKIYDKFAFPVKIDMRPYTIEHQSGNDLDGEPDMFELVGILVHSGTAESGHYYSFIKERGAPSDNPSWVEFNDELVKPWSLSFMEDQCFGGLEPRQADSDAGPGGPTPKMHSAYMLFYERCSPPAKQNEAQRVSGMCSPRCPVPDPIEARIKEDNWALHRRYCLYDPGHIIFVNRTISRFFGSSENGCSEDHKAENLGMQVALGHLDQVASRAKDTPNFGTLMHMLKVICDRCKHCAVTCVDYFNRRPEAMRSLLMRNPDIDVRQGSGQLFVSNLAKLRDEMPDIYGIRDDADVDCLRNSSPHDTLVWHAAEMFRRLWDTFHVSLRAWPELFGTMVDFAQLGPSETAALLDRDFLSKLLFVIFPDSHRASNQYARMATQISRRSANRPVNYGYVIQLTLILLHRLEPEINETNIIETARHRYADAPDDESLGFTTKEINIIDDDSTRDGCNLFIEHLIRINQNRDATDAIIERVVGLSARLDRSVSNTIRENINGHDPPRLLLPFLRAALGYCSMSEYESHVTTLIRHIDEQCRDLPESECRHFFQFHRLIFDATFKFDDNKEATLMRNLAAVPIWAPGLLGCSGGNLTPQVMRFLEDTLFSQGPLPVEDDDEEDDHRSVVNNAVRDLAMGCLSWLQAFYISRNQRAVKGSVIPLEWAVKQGTPWFELPEVLPGIRMAFHEAHQSVMSQLARLTVDELEEDGDGGWSDSSEATMEYD